MTELEARERLERYVNGESFQAVYHGEDSEGSSVERFRADLHTLLAAFKGEVVAYRWRWEGQSQWAYADYLPRPDADEVQALAVVAHTGGGDE